MTTADTRERFDRYHEWFQALLVNEFLELPLSEQERFIPIVEKFLKDCRQVAAESHSIKERRVQVNVTRVEEAAVYGIIDGNEIKMSRPRGIKVGSTLVHILFSLDGETWYSSKRELITGK